MYKSQVSQVVLVTAVDGKDILSASSIYDSQYNDIVINERATFQNKKH